MGSSITMQMGDDYSSVQGGGSHGGDKKWSNFKKEILNKLTINYFKKIRHAE